MSRLEQRTCVVTGGSRGIGRATVAMLLAEGANVLAMSRNEASLAQLAADLGSDRLATSAGSVADEAAVATAFATCQERFGPVQVLVNNAGVGYPSPDLSTADLGHWQAMLETNLTGLLICTRQALQSMLPAGGGHIINLISAAGQRTNPGAPLYCASKFGARGLAGGLADQVLAKGIKVTDVNPGPVDSDYWGDRPVPRELMLQTSDVAEVIRFVLTVPDHVMIREIDFDSTGWLAR